MSKFTINITRIMSVFLFLILILAAVTTSVFEINFYTKSQTKHEVAQKMNITEEELIGATEIALLYTKGYINNLTYEVERNGEKVDLYSEQDKVHMVDVQSLYKNAHTTLVFGVIVFAILAVVLIFKRKEVNVFMLTYTYNKTSMILLLFVVCLGIFAFANFNLFWTMFHKLFFTNDLWLMDPAKDALVNIFPEQLFMSLVFKIIGRFIMFFGVANIMAYLYREHALKGDVE